MQARLVHLVVNPATAARASSSSAGPSCGTDGGPPDGFMSLSWAPDSAYTTRPSPERSMAPVHIGQG
jgi:hypothetical protein